MAAKQDPNLDINYGWNLGEDGWNTGMDSSLKKLGAIVQLSVLSIANSPGGSPSNGDRYIVGTSASGAFAGQENAIAVRVESAWEFYTPRQGWLAYNLDDSAEYVFNGESWGFTSVVREVNGVSPSTSSGSITLEATDFGAQAEDATLTALSGYNSNGLLTQTSADTFTGRSIATASSSRITVANGDGVGGNPTVDLASSGVTPGTYGSSTTIPVPAVDTYGRITSISTVAIATDIGFVSISSGTASLTGKKVYNIEASGSFSIDTDQLSTGDVVNILNISPSAVTVTLTAVFVPKLFAEKPNGGGGTTTLIVRPGMLRSFAANTSTLVDIKDVSHVDDFKWWQGTTSGFYYSFTSAGLTANRVVILPDAPLDFRRVSNYTNTVSNITVAASPFVYQNTGSLDASVITSGGTVSAIEFSRDGVTYYSTGFIAGMITLSGGDYIRVTYTVAPTMTKVPR